MSRSPLLFGAGAGLLHERSESKGAGAPFRPPAATAKGERALAEYPKTINVNVEERRAGW